MVGSVLILIFLDMSGIGESYWDIPGNDSDWLDDTRNALFPYFMMGLMSFLFAFMGWEYEHEK